MFLLGRGGQMVSVLFSALSLLGASAVYWVLMSNFLYHTVKYLYGKKIATLFLKLSLLITFNCTFSTDLITNPTSGHLFSSDDDNTSSFNRKYFKNHIVVYLIIHFSLIFSVFCPDHINNVSYKALLTGIFNQSGTSTFDKIWNLDLTVPIYMAVLLLPLICLKSATFFTKFNALGTVSVFYIVAFVCTKASQWGLHVEFTDTSSPYYIPLMRSNFPALSGMLALALYLHNCVVSIMKNNRHQENNASFSFYSIVHLARN